MSQDVNIGNPLAEPLVHTLRRLREAQCEALAFRELFLLTLGLLGEYERQLQASQRTVARLRDERRVGRSSCQDEPAKGVAA